MKSILVLAITLCLLTICFPAQAQRYELRGKIVNLQDEGLPGVNVRTRLSKTRCITDAKGNFRLFSINENEALIAWNDSVFTGPLEFSGSVSGLRIILQKAEITKDFVLSHIDLEEKMDVALMSGDVRTLKSPRGGEDDWGDDFDDSWDGEGFGDDDFADDDWDGFGDEEKEEERVFVAPPSSKAGILTAGELQDFSKWDLWKDISSGELKEYTELWQMQPLNRYTVQLESREGFPLADAKVQLWAADEQLLWQSRTDNTGKAELWMEVMDASQLEVKSTFLRVAYRGQTITRWRPKSFQNGINIIKFEADCDPPKAVDIAFVVDATGSMGDEIAFLKAELEDIMQKARATLADKELRLASVFYRDYSDEYLTAHSDFSAELGPNLAFIEEQEAKGGGDFPEAVDEALQVAIEQLSWREEALSRILFLMLDAPPHKDPEQLERLKKMAAKAAEKGIRIVPVTASGIDKSTEYLMRCLALYSNGTYVFLTDHSGVGNEHLAPSTDIYEVETLNSLLLRLIFQYTDHVSCEAWVQTKVPQDTMVIFHPGLASAPLDSSGMLPSHAWSLHQLPDVNSSNSDSIGASHIIHWKYYPNPTSGIVHIEVEGAIGELYLSDISGKVLQRYVTNGRRRFDIDISNFPAGTYYIRYPYKEGFWLSGKVILLHN